MATPIRNTINAVVACALSLAVTAASAHDDPVAHGIDPTLAPREVQGHRYEPTIWIDPDGCEHWVMDDGFEGFMSPHRGHDGRPVCHRSDICGIVPTDQLFDNDEPWIPEAKKAKLMEFFRDANAFGFMIYGHTDANASDAYNMRLSQRRADMVASVARASGARVIDVKGFGERQPRVAGNSADAYRQNRRVEIYCAR